MNRFGRRVSSRIVSLSLLAFAAVAAGQEAAKIETWGDTQPLEWKDDIASRLVEGVDKFLLRELAESVGRREQHWNRDVSSAEKYVESLAGNRAWLAGRLGVRDSRKAFDGLELVASTNRASLLSMGARYSVYAVRWPVIRNIHGEGLLLVPDKTDATTPNVIAIPDADQTPEQIAGLVDGVPVESQFARRLAEAGCRVVVPVLISREMKRRAPPGQGGRANLTNREYVHRSAYELGRHLIGYEIQKVLACVDWFSREAKDADPTIGVIGYGEGGMLAMYSTALDARIDAVCVSGYFGPREKIWDQPIDRNVYGLLTRCGDAELAAMICPRPLLIDAVTGPTIDLPSDGGAPAKLAPPAQGDVQAELARLEKIVPAELRQVEAHFGDEAARTAGEFCGRTACEMFLKKLRLGDPIVLGDKQVLVKPATSPAGAIAARQQRQLDEIDEHNQWLLLESPYVRHGFFNIGLTSHNKADGSNVVDTSTPEKYAETSKRFRDIFRHDVIGHFDQPRLPFNPRSRKAYDTPTWTGYEVVLDVFPDVIAYGVLLVPKSIPAGEKRPVVVCQHGLEGRPQDIIAGDHTAYHDFAAKLAERGFITFAPQNLYIFKDRFRTLQRKAYPLNKTLFSVIVPQHQQIVDWLQTLPMVDPDRIAFYGLSYGGKSAMRIPSLVEDYCLSICSADFNEWVCKNASSRSPYSYVWTGEYEIFEFDLGSTFNYAEMAALIAPRPFMVERGHFDGVGSDEAVAYEYAKVQHLYNARLHLPERCAIEWFPGPHTINGKGTFDFLHQHLKWPKPADGS